MQCKHVVLYSNVKIHKLSSIMYGNSKWRFYVWTQNCYTPNEQYSDPSLIFPFILTENFNLPKIYICIINMIPLKELMISECLKELNSLR